MTLAEKYSAQKCPLCGHETTFPFQFCPECGRKIVPEELDETTFPDRLSALRKEVICAETAHLSVNSEQFWLLALGALEQAERFANLALYTQRQAINEKR